MIRCKMVFTKDLVETFNGSEHHINIVGVFSKLGIFDLLENGIKSHNFTWIRILKQQEHHIWYIVIDLSGSCVVKCKLVLF